MNSMIYLLGTTLKNTLKDLKNHPAKLVLVFIMAFGVVAVLLSGTFSRPDLGEMRNPAELHALILVLYLFMFVMFCLQGFSSGASFYSMADVNLLFSAPISSRRILIYGLVKQMGVSLLVGFFLLFQYGWLNGVYGLSVGGLLLILLGYCLVMFCSQLTAMAIYTFTSGNDRAKTVVKAVLYLLVVAAVVLVLAPLAVDRSDILGTLTASANALPLKFFPVAGWSQAFVTGALSGSLPTLLLGFGALAAYIIGFILLISKSHSDFYEDVLQATEVSFSAITARKEGKMNDIPQKNVKVGKTGIGKGWGADVFYHKHMLENRRARLFILDRTSMVFVATCIVFSFFLREMGILPVFFFSVYMQVFSSSLGRWVRELTLPYVYLIPISPFVKLVNLCKENIVRIATEAVVLFIPIGLIVGASPLDVVGCIVARIGFGFVFMAGNILTERILGSLSSKTLIMTFYFLIMILICTPGIILGFVLNFVFFADTVSLALVLCCTFVWNLLVSALVTFLCRDILNYAELNNR